MKEELEKQIAELEKELNALLPDAYVSDLANERYKELEAEWKELKRIHKTERRQV